MTTTINYAGHDVPVLGSYDVAIVGGGSSGAACAIRCAQLGLSVIIIDRFTMLGGTATNATVCPMMPTYVAHRQVFAQVEEGLKASGDATCDGTTTMVWFAPERLGRVYENLVTRSGGSILYDTTLVDVVDDGAQDGARTLQSLIAMTAQGLVAIDARTMVDASGDAVLARAAGVSTESGDETGANQVCSLRFIMGGIDVDTYRDYCLSLGDNFSPLKTGFFWESAMVAGRDFVLEPIFREGVADGLLEEGDLRYYQTFSVPGKPGALAFNCPHIPSLVTNTSAMGRSEAIIEAHATIDRLTRFLQAKMPGFEHSYLMGIAPMLGVRESWRINGVYRLTEEDYVNQARFEDGLVRGDWFIDVHSQSKGLFHQKGYEHGDYYEIPYRSLINPQVFNLLTVGRCISTTFLMQASVRITPTVIDMGDAAGCACALSKSEDTPVLELSGEKVRSYADEVSPLS